MEATEHSSNSGEGEGRTFHELWLVVGDDWADGNGDGFLALLFLFVQATQKTVKIACGECENREKDRTLILFVFQAS